MLFEQHAGVMMTVCRRYAREPKEAEDMLQEAFVRVFSYIEQFKFQGSFEGWIKRVTVNAALKVLQSRKITFSEISGDHQAFLTVEPQAVSNLSEEELLELISHLPDGYRTVFNLYALEGYNHDEIADMLHIKAASSRSQLSKARGLLREQIQAMQQNAQNHV
jgi:RNA polymerase sigma factor (sigma-70 family)